MKLEKGMKISGVYGDKAFTGTVAGIRLVDNGRLASTIGEALINIDDPLCLVGVFGCPDPEGRNQLFLTTTPAFELVDSRISECSLMQ